MIEQTKQTKQTKLSEEEKITLAKIKDQWVSILDHFAQAAALQIGQMVVIGCSTSEIAGQKIGKAGSAEIAGVLIEPLLTWANELGICLAFQCCEHLNRVLIVEQETVLKYNLEPVMVMPTLKAGGAMATAAWEKFTTPVAVEGVQAHAGLDIGDTFIGMHLRPVVVPVRIDVNYLGYAHLTLAKTRPKYVGGPRAAYPSSK
ncbi:MAG: TIGR01440 family protein [Peptococcaceae bacterium]|nr:TIGR01440 family protein [Peptococcaceae bacterium]